MVICCVGVDKMLRQIFRYCKPQKIDSPFKKLTFSNNHCATITFFKSNLICNFHSGNTYLRTLNLDQENIYAYNVLHKSSINKFIGNTTTDEVLISVVDFDQILIQNWRDSNIGEIVNAFLKVKQFCILNKIDLSDSRFDKLVDGLMDNCEHISDEQLIDLLHCLAELPPCESYTSHNFHDVWSCLDDICCWKIVDWDIEKSFTVASIWYKWHLGKLCDYIFTFIDRYTKKADNLSKDQLVRMYFCFNICRKRAVDFEYEFALEKLINEMTIEEMAVVAMGYFKSKTKIKLLFIQQTMAKRVMENAKTCEDISLSAILKTLRYSQPIKIAPLIQEMADTLSSEVDRLSDLSCTHLALLSTGIQSYNATILQKVSEKLLKNISNPDIIRIKDIERILNVLTMFNYDPNTTPDIFKAIFDELHRSERLEEVQKYSRCLICAMNYLSLKNMYSYDLLNKVLHPEYIQTNFGKGARNIPRELFSLDCSIDIDCTDYKGNRLQPVSRYKAAKWLTDYIPLRDRKLTATDKLTLETIDTVKNIVGDEKFMYVNHILPHFSRADMVVCKDKTSGKFVEPKGFHNYILGDVMFPSPNDTLDWFAVVVLGWNNTIRDSSIPLGHSIMQERQLKKIGYKPVSVIWNEFTDLSDAGRKQYILNKLI